MPGCPPRPRPAGAAQSALFVQVEDQVQPYDYSKSWLPPPPVAASPARPMSPADVRTWIGLILEAAGAQEDQWR